MAITLRHAKESAIPDSGDASLVQPSDWNSDHVLSQATGRLLGRSALGAGPTEEITVGAGLSMVAGVLTAVGGSGGGLPLQLPIQDGRYYVSHLGTRQMFGNTLGAWADVLVAAPFVAIEAKTWTEIGIHCDNGNAGISARLGIYASGADGLPDALILDAGEVDLSTSGNKTITISQALDANTIYWLVCCVQNDATARILWTDTTNTLALLFSGLSSATQFPSGCVVGAHAYGALPSAFPSPAITDDYVPIYIWLRTGV